jgi:diaminopimelate decarboxylase
MLQRHSDNSLHVEGLPIEELAQQFGTPLYVYSGEKIRRNIQRLKKAASDFFGTYRIQYAVKANNNPHLLKIIQEEGLGVDCSSPLELKLAQKMGFDLSRSTYTGNYESRQDLELAVGTGVPINLDDDAKLEQLKDIGLPEVLSFRINPGIGRGGFEQIITGGTDAKFGLPYERSKKAYQKALDLGVKRLGIHMMTGSNILEPFYFAEITQKLMSIIYDSLSDLGIKLEFINVGGGFGIPYTDEEGELDLEHAFKLVGEIFHYYVKRAEVGEPELAIEPGRYIVGNTGVLLSRVTHVKHSYRNYIGTDASMSTLLRPSLYKAFHRVWLDKKSELNKEKKYLICGQVCENSDIHPQERWLPEPEEGDLAVILDAGAYGYAMASNYNNRTRPAEVLVDKGQVTVIREREPEENLFSLIPNFEI